ncbi:hypothetical protein [Neorhodopirellula pilleata]|uniref:Uncharacterized protein n=1 Tax=Neorhodopirellula pilleata TaxID=2714738 RepID=A0A5C5ZX02_9BACT|nr:hypothetical protein [Neorhodopirellula pilleata]TWT92152.1 hypothetical protein Pla100_46880 [Neorhodopirellula pilleata]
MNSSLQPTAERSEIDIESIVRRVMHEFQKGPGQSIVGDAANPSKTNDFSLDQRLITLEDIKAIPAGVEKIQVPAATVVTPSVRDELRHRGITLLRGDSSTHRPDSERSAVRRTSHTPSRSPYRRVRLMNDETIDAGIFAAFEKQVAVRGIRVCDQAGVTVMTSARPAVAVYRSIAASTSAVLINRLDDVDRFKLELRPTVYVLDSQHLNLTAMVNAVVQIARRSEQPISTRPAVTVAGGQR